MNPFSVSSETLGEYEVLLKLFGIIPIKEISVEVIEELEEVVLTKYEGHEGKAVLQNNWSQTVSTSAI